MSVRLRFVEFRLRGFRSVLVESTVHKDRKNYCRKKEVRVETQTPKIDWHGGEHPFGISLAVFDGPPLAGAVLRALFNVHAVYTKRFGGGEHPLRPRLVSPAGAGLRGAERGSSRPRTPTRPCLRTKGVYTND